MEHPSYTDPNVDILRQATPASRGSGSSLNALTEFRVEKAHELVWLDVLTFQVGSFKRLLHRQLSSVGAVNPLDQGGRSEMTQIDKELQECLGPITNAMHAPENNKRMDTIRSELDNYCSKAIEKERYSHFVKAANTALLLLSDVQIGNSRLSPNRDSDEFVLFMVHDPKLMRSVHKKVVYGRKPDVVVAFQGHIRDLYGNQSDLLEAVRKEPDSPLEWKRALMCVEKKLKKPKIEKVVPTVFSIDALQERDYVEKATIETELRKEQEEATQSKLTPGTRSTKKRSAEDGPVRTGKKQKNPAGNTAPKSQQTILIEAPSAAAQVADYAAEAMYNCFGRSHIMNLLVTDSIINVWYFDHESPIQMTGFDFIDDLSYFFLFLFTLQRFNQADWGYIPGLVDINEGEQIDIPWETSLSRNALFAPKQDSTLYPKFGLNGRATGVVNGTVEGADVVIKVSYPEKSRTREHTFVKEARKRLHEAQHDDVCDYLPDILGAEEYRDFDSDLVRRAILVCLDDLRDKAARIPCLIVMPKYEAIASRTTNWMDFLNAFFALIYSHAMLWSIGIEHGDISETNLLWDPVKEKPKICDFDLSHFTGQQRPTGFSNTGTWAFMAVELLTPEAMRGEEPRLYRHDLESLFAVLIWVICRYNNGELLSDPPLEEWNQTHYLLCAGYRQATYRQLSKMKAPNGMPEDMWKVCVNATLTCRIQQSQAATFKLQVATYKDAVMAMPIPAAEIQQQTEFYETTGFLGPILSLPLFQLGDGPVFAAKLRERLPNLPSFH